MFIELKLPFVPFHRRRNSGMNSFPIIQSMKPKSARVFGIIQMQANFRRTFIFNRVILNYMKNHSNECEMR